MGYILAAITSFWGLAILRLVAFGALFATCTIRFVRKNGLFWLCLSFASLCVLCGCFAFLMTQDALPPYVCVSLTVCVAVLTAEIRRYTNRKPESGALRD